jgi:hypothetical protein
MMRGIKVFWCVGRFKREGKCGDDLCGNRLCWAQILGKQPARLVKDALEPFLALSQHIWHVTKRESKYLRGLRDAVCLTLGSLLLTVVDQDTLELVVLAIENDALLANYPRY